MLRLIILITFLALNLKVINAQDNPITPVEASNVLVTPFYNDEYYITEKRTCPNPNPTSIDCFQQGIYSLIVSPTDPETFFMYFRKNVHDEGSYIGYGGVKGFNFDRSFSSIKFSNNGRYFSVIKESINPNSSIKDSTIFIGVVGSETLTAVTSQSFGKYSTKDADPTHFLPINLIWSPNDEQIMFTAGFRDKDQPEQYSAGNEVFVMDRNGTNLKLIPFVDSPMLWTEYGIIFTSEKGAEYGSNRLYCIQPDGSDLIQLSDGYVSYEITLSPNGKYIAFSEWVEPSKFKIIDLSSGTFITNLETTQLGIMFDLGASSRDYVQSFAWSKDSTQIAFIFTKFAVTPQDNGNSVITFNLLTEEYSLLSDFGPIRKIYWHEIDGLIMIYIDAYNIYRILKLD